MSTYRSGKRVLIAVFVVLLVAGGAWASGKIEPTIPGLLVETSWLESRLDHDNLVIIDTGRSVDDYNAGHIPGAVYLNRSDYYGEVGGIPGMFTGVDEVTDALREAGVNDDSVVVVYDPGHGLWATRLFWTLELLGHIRVAVLNGGNGKWVAEGNPVSTVAGRNRRGDFDPEYRPELVVGGADISGNLENFTVVDCRSPAEYEGTDVRAARGGHIPGAINVNWVLNNSGGDVTTFLPVTALADFYDSTIGTSDETVVVTHCQTGVRGAHTYFVLRLLGYEEVTLYDASWVEWGNTELFPVVN